MNNNGNNNVDGIKEIMNVFGQMEEDPICYNLNCHHTLSNHGHTVNGLRCDCHKFIDEETNDKAKKEARRAARQEARAERLKRLAKEMQPIFSNEELEKLR